MARKPAPVHIQLSQAALDYCSRMVSAMGTTRTAVIERAVRQLWVAEGAKLEQELAPRRKR